MFGNIHSIETFGTVDGPGVRYVVFTQGCLLRCQYCHNADTWEIGSGKQMSVSEIIEDLKQYLPFIESAGGGITVSGGEPLLQIPFLLELFRECKNSESIQRLTLQEDVFLLHLSFKHSLKSYCSIQISYYWILNKSTEKNILSLPG